MKSLRDHEGYFLLDHREAPQTSDAELVPLGLPIGAGRGLFECPTFTCSHCGGVVMMNPKRNRERAYCGKCDHRLCDECGARYALSAGFCKTLKQVMDEICERRAKGETVGSVITAFGPIPL